MTCKHFQTQEENYNNKGSATWVILIKGVRCTKKFKKHCSRPIFGVELLDGDGSWGLAVTMLNPYVLESG